jgi:hypothetical protein
MARRAGISLEQPDALCSEKVAPIDRLKSILDVFFEREVKIRLPQ